MGEIPVLDQLPVRAGMMDRDWKYIGLQEMNDREKDRDKKRDSESE